jgi:hypothetical protein
MAHHELLPQFSRHCATEQLVWSLSLRGYQFYAVFLVAAEGAM